MILLGRVTRSAVDFLTRCQVVLGSCRDEKKGKDSSLDSKSKIRRGNPGSKEVTRSYWHSA